MTWEREGSDEKASVLDSGIGFGYADIALACGSFVKGDNGMAACTWA